MNRILILEVNGGSAVLLTVDGAFRTVQAQPGWEAGMELDSECLGLTVREPEVREEEPAKRGRVVALRRVGRWAVAAAACLLLLVGVQQGYHVLSTVDASVEIAINPVVRIELNRFGGVVGLVGVNGDGRALLEKVSQSNGSAVETLRFILNQAIADGYLSEEGRDILIAVAGKTNAKAERLEKDMSDTANRVFEEQGVRPALSVQKHSFDTTQQMRAYIDSLVEQGLTLEEAYGQAGIGDEFLSLMGVRVRDNDRLELRFTEDFSLTESANVLVTPSDGEAVQAEVVKVQHDRFTISLHGIPAGSVCTVRVEGILDEQGRSRAFTANFLNQKGKYEQLADQDDRARMERFGAGQFRVLFAHQKDETRFTGEESALLLTRSGTQIPCRAVGFEEGWWYLQAEKDLTSGEILSAAVFNVQSEKGRDTLFGDFLVWDAVYPVVERAQFNAEDDVVEVEFTEDFDWQSNLRVTAIAPDGTRIEGDIVEWPDGNDMEIRFMGLVQGVTYQLEISGTPFSVSVAGAFIASDDAEVDWGDG